MAAILRRSLCRALLSPSPQSVPSRHRLLTNPFFSTTSSSSSSSSSSSDTDSDEAAAAPTPESYINSEFAAAAAASQVPPASSSHSSSSKRPSGQIVDVSLEGGLDVGIYKAILVGQVGQVPFQKTLKSGRTVTMMAVGTGGINKRIPLDNEEPREYADRCAVHWHRVVVYGQALGTVMMKNVQPGSVVYVEGNLETKIFSDTLTGLVRRVREISVRRNGRLIFLGKGSDFSQPSPEALKGVGYY